MPKSVFKISITIILILLALSALTYFAWRAFFPAPTIPQIQKIKLTTPGKDTSIVPAPVVIHDTVSRVRKIYIPKKADSALVNKLIAEKDSLNHILDSLHVTETIESTVITLNQDTVIQKVNLTRNIFEETIFKFGPRQIYIPPQNYQYQLTEDKSLFSNPWIVGGAGLLVGSIGTLLLVR